MGQTVQQWDQKAQQDQQVDAQKSLNDLTTAVARYRVGEYASFGKNLKPFAELDVQIIDSLTITGNCNRAVATECVNDFYWGRTTRGQAETCFETKAGCTSKWSTMTDADKQALATKFNTSVSTLGQAYEQLNNRFHQDLVQGFNAHMQRKQAMLQDVIAAEKKVATQFGCD